MQIAPEQTCPSRDDTTDHWLTRVLRRWPMLVLVGLVALVAAVGFVLAGSATAASAAPPPASPASGPNAGEPGRWKTTTAKINGVAYQIWYNDALDPSDPNYKAKLAAQIGFRRIVNRTVGGGNLGAPSASDIPGLLDDITEYVRRMRQTVDGLNKQVNQTQKDIERLKQEASDTNRTKAQRDRAAAQLREKQARYNRVFRDHEKAKAQAKPFDWDAEVDRLTNRVRDLEREAKNPRLTERGREQAQQRVADARTELSDAQADRKRLQGPDDDSGAARTPARGPKNPPKTPTTAGAKDAPKTPTAGGAKTRVPPVGPAVRTPRGGGVGLSGTFGELFGQHYADQLSDEHRKLLEDALKDPALRKRVIDDYNQIKDDNALDTLVRGLDTSKGFTQGATRDIGPKLIEHQKKLDTTKRNADKSNADPLYQQARRDCGGYDTCVTERVRKLREQNAKALADSTKKAQQSNADPLYQRARQECGGYDTCVQDRLKKLRQEKAKTDKAIAESTKKAQRSTNDPLYQRAQHECGGYDTCVQDRLKKLRATKAATTAKPKTTTAKPKTTTSKPKTDPALAKKQYEDAAKVCGGYETCIKDRLNKVRGTDTKATPTKPKTTTSKPKTTTVKPKTTTAKPKTTTVKPKTTTSKPKTDPALAKKQYEDAAKVCGGYETCIKDRLNKVRGTDTKATPTKPKTTTAKPKTNTKK